VTDEEFDLLDSLYFVISFEEIKAELGWQETVLRNMLQSLLKKGWVKCFKKGTDEEIEGISDFESQYQNYNYLATKEGLHAHNSR
jgi:hypothetical protein